MKRAFSSILLAASLVCCLGLLGCAAAKPAPEPEAKPSEKAPDIEAVRKRIEQLAQERRKSSVANYQQALALHGEGKDTEALSYARQAVEDDSSNTDAAGLLAEVRKALGKTDADAGGRFEHIEVQRQLMQRELTERFAGGEKNLRAGQYADAVQDFREVLRIIRIGRLILDTGDLETRARALLAEAEDKKRVEDLQKMEEQERLARRELEKEIDKRRKEKEERLAKLWNEFEFHRSRHDYERARQTLEAIMAEDAERKDSYLRSLEELDVERNAWERRQLQKDLELNTQIQMNEIEAGMIPYEDVFNYGDREEWRGRILKRAEEIKEMYVAATVKSEEDIRVLNLVKDAIVADFKTSEMILAGRPTGKPNLVDIKDYLRKIFLDIEFDISPDLKGGDVVQREVNIDLPGRLKLISVLNHTCLQLGISWRVQRGTVMFTSKERAADMIVRRYDVSDIVFPIRDFPGAMLKLSEGEQAPVPLGGDENEEDVNRINRFNLDQLIKLIKLNTGRGADDWSDNPDDLNLGYIQKYNKEFLYVRQNEDVHEEINLILGRVRKLNSILVNIETRFITVQKNFLRQVGVDFRNLGPVDPNQDLRGERDIRLDVPGVIRWRSNSGPFTSGMFYSDSRNDIAARTNNIVNASLLQTNLTGAGGTSIQLQILDKLSLEAILRAVRQDSNQQLLTAPRITCFNSQQASIFVGTQLTYIKSFKTGSGSVNLPELDLVASSTVFDVRPVVSADRRYITLFLRPVITFAPDLTKKARFRRGNDAAGNPILLEVDLPSQDSQDLRTVVVVPDGGSVLIGGLKEAEDKYRKGEIPILGKLPLVGFFFRSELDSNARRQLLVLVTAKIIAPDEEEGKL